MNRDELYRRFGPALLEAHARLILDYINEIREHIDLPKITKKQALADIQNHLSSLEEYDWMKENTQ